MIPDGYPALRWLKLPCAFAALALQNKSDVDVVRCPGDHVLRRPDDYVRRPDGYVRGPADELRPGVRRLPDDAAAAVPAIAGVQ